MSSNKVFLQLLVQLFATLSGFTFFSYITIKNRRPNNATNYTVYNLYIINYVAESFYPT
jgi:hypothetical protein